MEFGWPHWQVSISSIYLHALWSLDGHIGKCPFQYLYILYGVWMATLASVHFKYIFTYSMGLDGHIGECPSQVYIYVLYGSIEITVVFFL